AHASSLNGCQKAAVLLIGNHYFKTTTTTNNFYNNEANPMASIPQGSSTQLNPADTGTNTVPLVIITILFFMWGLLTSMNDVLIPHLKSVYTLTYTQAMLVQFCFFGAYFVVSLPAGALIKRLGYQNGAVAGLVIAASGCA